MIFQLILIAALGVLTLYAYFQWKRAPLLSLGIMALAAGGMGLAIYPDLATWLAHRVGIGRGADLVIYCFVLIALAAIFNLHIKLRATEDNLTQLTRALALMSATPPGKTGKDRP